MARQQRQQPAQVPEDQDLGPFLVAAMSSSEQALTPYSGARRVPDLHTWNWCHRYVILCSLLSRGSHSWLW